MPAPRSARLVLRAGIATLLAGLVLLAVPASRAAATVTHVAGFEATVDGFTSWYGSYGMGVLGTAWCIDHGIRAPDPAFAYLAADLSAVPASTQAAMAWVVSAHGQGSDPVDHAAVMLVLHDLMGAVYPSGPLDVDALGIDRLAGFDGHEAEVLTRARWFKADGLAHEARRGPLRLTATLTPAREGAATLTVAMVDAEGQPLVGVPVHVDGPDGALGEVDGVTDAAGRWQVEAHPTTLPLTVHASATVPSPVLDAWAPSTTPAQRVARPRLEQLDADATLEAPPPPPTTTTTTTTAPPTTTTIPSTTSIATTVAPMPPSTGASPPTAAPPVAVPALPRTGATTDALALVGAGLLLVGIAALDSGRRAVRTRRVGHHGRDGASGRH